MTESKHAYMQRGACIIETLQEHDLQILLPS